MRPKNDTSFGLIVNQILIEYFKLGDCQILIYFVKVPVDKVFGKCLEIVKFFTECKELSMIF